MFYLSLFTLVCVRFIVLIVHGVEIRFNAFTHVSTQWLAIKRKLIMLSRSPLLYYTEGDWYLYQSGEIPNTEVWRLTTNHSACNNFDVNPKKSFQNVVKMFLKINVKMFGKFLVTKTFFNNIFSNVIKMLHQHCFKCFLKMLSRPKFN